MHLILTTTIPRGCRGSTSTKKNHFPASQSARICQVRSSLLITFHSSSALAGGTGFYWEMLAVSDVSQWWQKEAGAGQGDVGAWKELLGACGKSL